MSFKTKIILLVLFLILDLSFSIYLFVWKPQIDKQALLPKPTPKPTAILIPPPPSQLTNLEIAGKVLDWVNKQKSEKGVYYFSRILLSDGTEPEPALDNRTGISVIWGNFKNWQKTKSEKRLTALKTDIATYQDPKKINVIQNDFWNCKLMYELWMENGIPKDVREGAKNICETSSWYASEVSKDGFLSKEAQITDYPEPDLKQLFQIKNSSSISQIPDDAKRKITEYSAYSSDFTTLYLWDKDKRNLNIAKSLFNIAVEKYSQLRKEEYIPGECTLGIAALDLYKTTSEKKYLTFTQSLIKNDKISEQCSPSTPSLSNSCLDNIFEEATCLKLFKELYKTTSNPQDKISADALTRTLKQRNFDTKSNNAFYSTVRYEVNKEDLVKDVRSNALLGGIFSE